MTRARATAETFLFGAMGLVSLTFAVALSQHGNLPAAVSAPAAVAAFVIMLSVHMLIWRRTRDGGQIAAKAAKPQRVQTAKAPPVPAQSTRAQAQMPPAIPRAPRPPRPFAPRRRQHHSRRHSAHRLPSRPRPSATAPSTLPTCKSS